MPYISLPPDPEPTDADLKPFLSNQKIADWPIDSARLFALMKWRKKQRLEHSSIFHQNFPPTGYKDYLQSLEWKLIRQRVFTADGYECVGCGNYPRHVHHRDYRPRVMAGEDIVPLVALCSSCHRKVHHRGKSTSWYECEQSLATLVEQRDLETG